MLRLPVKVALLVAGAISTILGAHGLYVHSSRTELLFGGKDPNDLFLTWNVPTAFDGMVSWASTKGFESWFLPGTLIVGGLMLLGLQSNIHVYGLRLPRFLRKLW